MKLERRSARHLAFYGGLVLYRCLALGFVLFAFRVNEKLKGSISGVERGLLVSLSIVGMYYLLTKASDYVVSKLEPRGAPGEPNVAKRANSLDARRKGSGGGDSVRHRMSAFHPLQT